MLWPMFVLLVNRNMRIDDGMILYVEPFLKCSIQEPLGLRETVLLGSLLAFH